MILPTESLARQPRHLAMAAPQFQTVELYSNGVDPSGKPSPSTSSSRSSSRFSPSASTFLYNARVAIALAPSALFLLSLGGIPVVATLSLGLIVAYFLDSFNLKHAAFFLVWFSLVTSQIALLLSGGLASFPSWSLFLLSFGLCSLAIFLIGVWASIQFRWMILENASVVTALERLLFACTPIVASIIWTWAAVASIGMNHAAYYLMCFSCVFYWLFSIPRRSSFRSRPESHFHGGEIPDDALILGPLETCIHTLVLLFLPLLFRVGSHYSVTFSSATSVCDLLLLFFVPFLFQLYASTNGALWWITKNVNELHSIRIVNGAIGLVVVVICLEIRVIFHSFGRYLHVPPPLNYVLVTVAMLGSAAGAGSFAVGMVGDAFSSAAFSVLAVLVGIAGAIVVGFPFLLLPIPAISGFFLAQFFTKKSLTSYFTFVLLASFTVTWFVKHNFWGLSIWLAGMSLQSFCKLIVASMILAMAVPGFSLLPVKLRFVTDVGLISHALLLCYLENQIYSHSSMYYFVLDDEVLYPSYMVITTTVCGLALVRRLFLDHRIGPKAVWVLTCIYSSKLVMLFITSTSAVWVSLVLLLAISPPFLLYRDKSKSASKMAVWQGFMHAGVVVTSTWLCRETIFEALQWWMGRPPTDGLLLGTCILLMGLGCIPIVSLHFSHVQSAKRVLVLVVALGLLFVLMQPPVPFSLAFRSELIKAAHLSADDSSIYGFTKVKPSWPSWLLISTIMLTLAAATNIIPVKYIVELRTFYAVGVGITSGIYICAEYFLQTVLLHVLIVATVVCTSIFVVFTHLPSASSPRILPWIFALVVALFPVTYLLEGQLRVVSELDGEGKNFATLLAIEGARASLLGLYAAIFMLIALEIKFELASLLREKAQERGFLHNPASRGSGFNPKIRLLQQRRASTAPSFTVKKLAAEGAWMPVVGNAATIICFTTCLLLSIYLTGGSNRSIFLLAPILLLLNQDSDFFTGFGDRQRYFPVTVVISGYLVLNALYRVWEEIWHGDAGWGLEIGGPGWFFAVKNVALLVLTLPNHILFNRFMWDFTKQADAVLLLTMPLNLPSIVITDISTVLVLGLLGIIYSLVQYLTARQIRIAGMKYI
ncbi:unnamed protein product [Victoria cruziana]